MFKLEFQGDNILLLCSKSYICVGDNKCKLAQKGVNASQNNLRFNHYENVLATSTQIATTNKGKGFWDKTVTMYEQTKVGLTCIYIKRKVQNDGFSTQHLCL